MLGIWGQKACFSPKQFGGFPFAHSSPSLNPHGRWVDDGGRGGWTSLDGLKKGGLPKKGLHPFFSWTGPKLDGNFRVLDGNFRLLDGF